MSNYIEVFDYEGNKVVCTRDQWFSHIASGHEIMRKNKMAVEETINSPDTVYTSSTSPIRKVFFKTSSNATYGTNLKTKVIVEYACAEEGEVVTAFPTKTETGGVEDVIYPRQN